MAINVGSAVGYLDLDIGKFSQGLKTASSDLEKTTQDMNRTSGRNLEQLADKFKSAGESMSNIGTKASTMITLPIAGAITAVVKSFGDLEQAIGGVETLFKDSASTVIKNAETSYKRAGTSATQYMEQVTSFSARLLQGLNGDTAEAARIADQAIVDMSDNANKMGTDLEMIQNAYQGFAKANYTMLDNLKLGYGGTKGEMQRLLEDASKLAGIRFDINNFDDIIQAIHVIQEEIGITGTTALEAEHTVMGSINTLKAAFSNFVAGLGMADADIDRLSKELAEAFSAAFENVKRVIKNIWDNIDFGSYNWVKTLVPVAAAFGPVTLAVGKTSQAIGSVISVIGKADTAFSKLDKTLNLSKGTASGWALGISGAALVIGLFIAEAERMQYQVFEADKAFNQWRDSMLDSAKDTQFFIDGLDKANLSLEDQETILSKLEERRNLLSEAENRLAKANDDLADSVGKGNVAQDEARRKQLDAWNVVNQLKGEIDLLSTTYETSGKATKEYGNTVDTVYDSMGNIVSQTVNGVLQAQEDLLTGEAKLLADREAQELAHLDEVRSIANQMGMTAEEYVEEEQKRLDESVKAREDYNKEQQKLMEDHLSVVSNIWDQVEQKEVQTLDQLEANLEKNTAQYNDWQNNLKILTKLGLDSLAGALEAGGQETADQTSAIVKELYKLNDGAEIAYGKLNKTTQERIDELNYHFDEAGKSVTTWFKNRFEDPDFVNAPSNAVSDMSEGVQKNKELETALEVVADEGEKAVISKYDDFRTVGQEITSAIADGVTKQDGELIRAGNELITTVYETIEIKLNNTAFDNIGQRIPEGIAKGINQSSNLVSNAVREVINRAEQEARNAAGINSPAKLFMPIGSGIDEGIGVGMEQFDYAVKSIDKLMETVYNEASKFEVPEINYVDPLIGNMHNAVPTDTNMHNNRNWGISSNNGQGDTYIFNSPVKIDEVEAARLLKQTKRDISEGF